MKKILSFLLSGIFFLAGCTGKTKKVEDFIRENYSVNKEHSEIYCTEANVDDTQENEIIAVFNELYTPKILVMRNDLSIKKEIEIVGDMMATPRWIYEKARVGDFNEDGKADVLVKSINTEGTYKGMKSFCFLFYDSKEENYESTEVAGRMGNEDLEKLYYGFNDIIEERKDYLTDLEKSIIKLKLHNYYY